MPGEEERKKLGAALPGQCLESLVVLGRHGTRCEGLPGEDRTRKEVEVLKRFERGKEMVWFKEKTTNPPKKDQDDEQTVDDDETLDDVNEPALEKHGGMQHDTPEEIETRNKMWLMEKVSELEKENEEMKTKIQEMEARILQQTQATSDVVAMRTAIQNAFAEVADHFQRQIVFNESTRTSITGLVQEVKKHQDRFQEFVCVCEKHEQHIANHGVAWQEMAQYINALALENEKKSLWIADLMRETNAQSQVLQEQHVKQQVLAEVMKRVLGLGQQQQPQQPQCQAIAGAGPTVTEVDDEDEDRLNFLGGHSPQSGPPNGGMGQMIRKPPRAPKDKVIARRK